MKSALIVDFSDRHGHERALGDLLAEVRYLAAATDQEIRVSFQNNLKTELLAIMIEMKGKTLGGHGDTFLKAATSALKDVREYRDQLHQEEVQAAGEKCRTRHRRKVPARKRIRRVREG